MRAFYILIMISIIGLGIGAFDVYMNDKPTHGDSTSIPKIKLPFSSFIAASGILESASKNIKIGSSVSGLITKVYVKDGDKVEKGDLLFSLDDSVIKNKIGLLEAKRVTFLAKLKKAKNQFKVIKNFKKVSPHIVTNQNFKLKKDTLAIAQASFLSLEKQLKIIKRELEFYKIHSPIDGIVLSSNLTTGAYFNKNSPNNMLLICSNKLNLKVSINEYDIWKFQAHTKAVAFVRGKPKLMCELKYLYTIPYVVAKSNLTGKSTEKTDTRVLNVLYQLTENSNFPLFVGQQLDVFIQTER